MRIRLPCARRTPALFFAGLLFLPLVAASKLTAGEDNSCPVQGCGPCSHSKSAASTPTAQIRVTYQVADLVFARDGALASSGACKSSARCGSKANATQEDQLIKLITNAVEPRSWSDMGGPGTIDYHPLTKSLVINQTPDTQEQIADLLNSLRRLQDQEVTVEVRILSVDEALDMRLIQEGKEGTGSLPADSSDPSLRVTFLSAEQTSQLLEAAQADPRTNVMQAPKLTTFDGQSLTIGVTEPESFVTSVNCLAQSNGHCLYAPHVEEMQVGLCMTARPVVSADRRFVNTTLKVNLSKVDDPKADLIPIQVPISSPADPNAKTFTQLVQWPRISRLALDGTLKIPDGGTALVRGWKREQGVRTEHGMPILSDIPYLDRLFKNVGYSRETECVMLLVTPRVIVKKEKEETVTGKVEQASCPCESASNRCTEPVHFKQAAVAELVEKYHRACAEGHTAEATQLAVQALAMDPACFHTDGVSAAADR